MGKSRATDPSSLAHSLFNTIQLLSRSFTSFPRQTHLVFQAVLIHMAFLTPPCPCPPFLNPPLALQSPLLDRPCSLCSLLSPLLYSWRLGTCCWWVFCLQPDLRSCCSSFRALHASQPPFPTSQQHLLPGLLRSIHLAIESDCGDPSPIHLTSLGASEAVRENPPPANSLQRTAVC